MKTKLNKQITDNNGNVPMFHYKLHLMLMQGTLTTIIILFFSFINKVTDTCTCFHICHYVTKFTPFVVGVSHLGCCRYSKHGDIWYNVSI